MAATCTEAGYCSVCGEAGEAALGHTWVAPTCTEAGYCANCNAAGEPAKGHGDYQVVYMGGPTCTEHANIRVTCNGCGYEVPAEEWLTWESFVGMDKLGHSFGEATCTAPATCTRCGETEGEKLAHTEEVIPGKAPTCTETGLTEGKKCSVCGEILVAQEEVAMVEHNWDEGVVTTEPTEEATGVKTYTCSACGETKTEELPKLEHVHKYEGVVTAPTCEDGGYTTYTCECGDSYVADQVVALGHTFVDGNCTVCGSPETGDATVIIMVMSAMALMAAAAVVFAKKKYF